VQYMTIVLLINCQQ